jgi:Putative prokaryotic signal transducing protein
VSEPDLEPGLRVVATANNEIEAAMMAGYLQSAIIRSTYRQGFRSAGGTHDVYVNEADLERAREALSTAEEAHSEPA